MNIFSGRTGRPCITPNCANRCQARSPNATCSRCTKLAKQRVSDSVRRAAFRELRDYSGPLRDASPLWPHTEPLEEFKPLGASIGLVCNRHDELRRAA